MQTESVGSERLEDEECGRLLTSISHLGSYRGDEYRERADRLKTEAALLVIRERPDVVRAHWTDRDVGEEFKCPACVDGISNQGMCSRCEGTGKNITRDKVTLVIGAALEGEAHEWRFPPSLVHKSLLVLPLGDRESFRAKWGIPPHGPRGPWSPQEDMNAVEQMIEQQKQRRGEVDPNVCSSE